MMRMSIQDPSTPNHWDEALQLQSIVTGIGLILKAGQTPDEWSRHRLWFDLLSIASTVEVCHANGFRGHKDIADWCKKVSSIAERRAWDELNTYLLLAGERYAAALRECTSNPIKY